MQSKYIRKEIEKLNIQNNTIINFEAKLSNNFEKDKNYFGDFWKIASTENNKLKLKTDRKKLRNIIEITKKQFLEKYSKTIYNLITDNKKRHVKINNLIFDANKHVPYLTPSKKELLIENKKFLKDKEGIETNQGLLLSSILAHQDEGNHLCHSMLLPSKLALEKKEEFQINREIQFDGAKIKKYDKHIIVTLQNKKYLNAEDERTLLPLEAAIDLAILDEETEI